MWRQTHACDRPSRTRFYLAVETVNGKEDREMFPRQEYPTDPYILQNLPDNAAWQHETDDEREWRHALSEFFDKVKPVVFEMIGGEKGLLTKRQQQAVFLYFVCNLPQEEVARRMALSQSTVSRHIFGTSRNRKTVGGAIPKLRKFCCTRKAPVEITEALAELDRTRSRHYTRTVEEEDLGREPGIM